MTIDDYRDGLRDYLRDHADLNRLLEFEEENTSLDLYIYGALGLLNSIPPNVITYGIDNFPIPFLLIHQATLEVLISNSIVQARNDLTYNNGGISVKEKDRDRYINLINILERQLDRELKQFNRIKINVNVNSGWGGVQSPYAYLESYNLPRGIL